MRFAGNQPGPAAGPGPARARLIHAGAAVLLAALAVELADELFGGTISAAMPLIRHDLQLSYAQVGLLSAVPMFVGSVAELPFGIVSGTGARRRRFILSGGVVFVGAVLAASVAGSFGILLAALVVFFPASGVFVSLTQAALLDADPARQAQRMARWTLAGSVGAVLGPLLLTAVLASGGTWRLALVLVAAASAAAWLAVAVTGRPVTGGPVTGGPVTGTADPGSGWPGWRTAARLTRQAGALHWLTLLQVSDVLLDVFTTFLALYLIASVHVTPSVAALGVAVRLGAGVAGDTLLVRVLERLDSRRVLRASVWLTAVLFPAFLLVPGLGPKLVLLAAVTVVTAPWYPVLQAELFGSLPDHSGLAVSLSSAAGLVGGLGPLAVGLLAQWLGLTGAMAMMCVVPLVMLTVLAGNRVAARRPGSTKLDLRD